MVDRQIFPGNDLEDIVMVQHNNRTLVFVLSENEYGETKFSAKIFVYDIATPEIKFQYNLDTFDELEAPEGLTFVPDNRYSYGGLFFVGDATGLLIGFELVPQSYWEALTKNLTNSSGVNNQSNSTEVLESAEAAILPEKVSFKGEAYAMRLLNKDFMNRSIKDPKIGALGYEDNLLYILYDNEKVMQAWDINTATLKAKYHFKWMNKQVEGFAFVPVKEGTQSSTRQVYMVVDTPPTLYLVDIPIP